MDREAEFGGEFLEEMVFLGGQFLLILFQPLLDGVEAFGKDSPVEGRKFSCQGLVCNESTTPGALPVREGDNCVQTVHGPGRAPTVIVLANYARVPKRRPKFSAKNIWQRDGATCQYTGRKLAPHEGNIDHVVPRSRGGRTPWENCVLAHREINSRKADRLPEEAGLRLRRQPSAPRELPATVLIRNAHRVRDWEHFLKS